jgi:TonB family protein
MGKHMQSAAQPAGEPISDSTAGAPRRTGLPRLDLAVSWGSPWQDFRTSVSDFFAGPLAVKTGTVSGGPQLRVHWIQDKLPRRTFVASSLWHIAGVLVLTLPIWSLLPSRALTLEHVRINLAWDPTSQDLPPISLPARAPKPSPQPKGLRTHDAPPIQRGADAYHPRQTILSMPMRITHPRQMLIQPEAPLMPPKISPQLPNIVEWPAASPPKPRLLLSPTASAPRVQRHIVRAVAAPDISSADKSVSALNIAPSPSLNPMPRLPVNLATATPAARRRTHADTAAAPEVANTTHEGDSNLTRLIALSATPAPPAPQVSVPQGNLAARIAISPEGTKASVPGADQGGAGGSSGSLGSAAPGTAGGGGTGSVPVAVSVSGGSGRSGNGGGIAPAAERASNKLILKPMASLPARPDPMVSSGRGPAVVGKLDPHMPPEKILSGKEVYTIQIDLPNLTSATGSWILHFAQLEEDAGQSYRLRGKLSSPTPLRKVDPRYPQALINEHVEGEVILYAIIRKDGSVDSIQLVRGIDPQLDKNAIEALAQWQFRPAAREGAPTDVEAVVHIPFRYRKPGY